MCKSLLSKQIGGFFCAPCRYSHSIFFKDEDVEEKFIEKSHLLKNVFKMNSHESHASFFGFQYLNYGEKIIFGVLHLKPLNLHTWSHPLQPILTLSEKYLPKYIMGEFRLILLFRPGMIPLMEVLFRRKRSVL